jgi:hypothetical protein
MSHNIHMTEITTLEHKTCEGQAPHRVEKIISHYCDLSEQWGVKATHCLGFLCRLKSAIRVIVLVYLLNVDGITDVHICTYAVTNNIRVWPLYPKNLQQQN